mmetsp:Transcript_3685/g.9361  ORF Transcript_3685/g.9361 Transcript_3685/m.9361 type:complete len:114 (-) Transcript_3685:70-411(-)
MLDAIVAQANEEERQREKTKTLASINFARDSRDDSNLADRPPACKGFRNATDNRQAPRLHATPPISKLEFGGANSSAAHGSSLAAQSKPDKSTKFPSRTTLVMGEPAKCRSCP